jgi:hypothetical protein
MIPGGFEVRDGKGYCNKFLDKLGVEKLSLFMRE